MDHIDWTAAPSQQHEHRIRYAALKETDVIQLLRKDPRDMVVEDLLYHHPNPASLRWQIDGGLGFDALFGQLVAIELIGAGVVARDPNGDLRFTLGGLVFAAARLDGPNLNSQYRVRTGAPSYAPPSAALAIALKHMLLPGHPHVARTIGIAD